MCGIMMLQAEWDAEAPASRMTIEEAMAHAGAPAETGKDQNAALTPDEFTHWLKRECFTDYIWKGRKSAWCTACGAEIIADAFMFSKHGTEERCPECGKTVILREKRYGHKRINDEFYAVRWKKSAIETGTLVMIGYYCALDSRGPMPELEEKKIVPVLIDVFRYGKGAKRFQRSVWSYGKPMGESEWLAMKEVRAIRDRYFKKRVAVEAYLGSYDDAISGTPFAGASECIRNAAKKDRRMQSHMFATDNSELIDAIARRPWIEYMIKAGFTNIALGALGNMPRGAINPKGKNLRAILKLSTDRFAEIKGRHMDPSVRELQIVQSLDGYGVRVKMNEVVSIARKLGWRDWPDIEREYGAPDRELVKYMLKIPNHSVSTLMHYWRMAREAGITLDTPEAKLPRNLEQAHDRAMMANQTARARSRISGKDEEELTKKLDARIPKLEQRYTFEHAGLVLRPARSFAELIEEGNALCHCVAGYFRSYALGRTDICLLRHADAPEMSWRTIEFDPKTGARIQDRGYKNDYAFMHGRKYAITPELRAELDAFWEAFDRWREDSMLSDAMKGDGEIWKRAG